MTNTSGNCCCDKYWKAEPVETISRIGEQDSGYGLYVPKTSYDSTTYATGHIFRDPHNYCFGPVLTDRMVSGLQPFTGVPNDGINYDNFSSNYSDSDESGNNFANCEDCLLYHLRHKNTKDGTTGGGGSYGRMYAIVCLCDCNDYFQFNQDARGDSPANAKFKRFAFPGCQAEELGYAADEAYPDCPDGGVKVSDIQYLTDIGMNYDESSASKQDGLPTDMTHRYYYIDYTPLLEEVKNSNHPQYLTPGASVAGESYNVPDHTSLGTSQPNSTLKTAGAITFASDTTSKANVSWTYTGTAEARVPLNFFSGDNRSSIRFTFSASTYASGVTSDTTVTLVSTDGTSKVYKAVTGSPTASNREFQATTSATVTAANFKTIVENDDHGHGKLKLHVEVDGGTVTVMQTVAGEAGNKTISHHATFDDVTSENIPDAFIGGSDASDNFLDLNSTTTSKGTFLIMDMDPMIDNAVNAARRVNRSFKIVGFTQYKPEVESSYQSAFGAIDEIPLDHIYAMHFRMNPTDSSKYYGCEGAIAEGNGSFCCDTSQSAAANTLQLGTGTILSEVNEDSDAVNDKWQGSDPCTRKSDSANVTHGEAVLTSDDFGNFCGNANNLPPTIEIIRKFDCTSDTSPWRHFVTLEPYGGTQGGVNTTDHGCNKTDWGLDTCTDEHGQTYSSECVKNVSCSPWGNYVDDPHGNGTDLKIKFTYTLGATKDECSIYEPIDLNSVYPSVSPNGSFMAPKESDGDVDPANTEPYMTHYYLSGIEILDQGEHYNFDQEAHDTASKITPRNPILWITDPYINIKPNNESNYLQLDRRFLTDSACTISDLFSTTTTGYEPTHQACHKMSSSIKTRIPEFFDSSDNDYKVNLVNFDSFETTRGIFAHYIFGGFENLNGSVAVAANLQSCPDGCNDRSININHGTNVSAYREKALHCNSQASVGEGNLYDPYDTASTFNGLAAYVGPGLPKQAPTFNTLQFDSSSPWVTAQAEGHSFMPVFTIGIPHSLNPKYCNHPHRKPKTYIRDGIEVPDVPTSLCSDPSDTYKTCNETYAENSNDSDCGSGFCGQSCGEEFNNSLYEYSTYVIPAGIFVKTIDPCGNDSDNNTSNGDTRDNKCIFGLSWPIRESQVTNNDEVMEWWEGFYRSFSVPVSKCYEWPLLNRSWDVNSDNFTGDTYCNGVYNGAVSIFDQTQKTCTNCKKIFMACNNFGLANGERTGPNTLSGYSRGEGWCEDNVTEASSDDNDCTRKQLASCSKLVDWNPFSCTQLDGNTCVCGRPKCTASPGGQCGGDFNTGGGGACMGDCCGGEACCHQRSSDWGPPNGYVSGISERFETNSAADCCTTKDSFFLDSFFHKNVNKYKFTRILGTDASASNIKYCPDKAIDDASASHPGPCRSFFSKYNSNEFDSMPNWSTSHALIHLAILPDIGCDDHTSLADHLTYYKSTGS